MADDLSKRGQQDRSRVNVNEAHEVAYWTQRFGCSKDQLENAVRQVGVDASRVEAFLKSGAGSSPGSQR